MVENELRGKTFMENQEPVESKHEAPLGQRIFDSPFLLLILGLVVMFGFYTIWGFIEILSLPKATLP